MVDGPGFRTSIYCAGCRHQCPGCHNPQSWAFNQGHEMSVNDIMKIIEADPYANVTFSGGDPMYQAAEFAELAREIHERTNKDIWCYTGFTYESLKSRGDEWLLFGLSVLFAYLVMVAYRESWRRAFWTLLPSVAAVFGAMSMLWITGVAFSVYSRYAANNTGPQTHFSRTQIRIPKKSRFCQRIKRK